MVLSENSRFAAPRARLSELTIVPFLSCAHCPPLLGMFRSPAQVTCTRFVGALFAAHYSCECIANNTFELPLARSDYAGRLRVCPDFVTRLDLPLE